MKKVIGWIAVGVVSYAIFLKASEVAQCQGIWHQVADKVES
ncbi:hypothetical protein [Arcanobacterium ihumii]|nr:hypothetical protein [Arcanobacterium ihumii]